MLGNLFGKIREFIKKDPVVFVLVIIFLVVGFTFANIEILHITSESKFCGSCHPEEKFGPLGEYYTWSKNIHSTADVECIDCHGKPGFVGYMEAKIGGLKDLYGEFFKSYEHKVEILTKGATDKKYAAELLPNETCLHCHSDSVNAENRKNNLMSVGVNFRKIDNVVNPRFRESFGKPDILAEKVSVGVEPNHAKHILEVGLNCVDCHLGVAHGGELHNLPKMETCFTCHYTERAKNKNISAPKNEECEKCHTMQKGIQQGTYVEGVEETPWYMADLNCSDCHSDAFSRPNSDKCVSCHDESYASVMFDIQRNYLEKLANVQKVRDNLFAERLEMPEGKRKLFNEANRLVRLLEIDGSKGVHNPEYFDIIFEKAHELLKATEEYVEPVKVEKVHMESAKANKNESTPEEKSELAEKKEFAGNPSELMEIAPEEINLAEQHGIKSTKKAVIFKHKEHAERLACGECHSNPEEGKLKFEITNLSGTNNDFHKQLCFPCHKENKVPKGTSCTTCHK